MTGLRAFREVVESGSFTAAAGRLAISAPMVSKHIAELERRLGARLLNRSSRHLSLTEAGALYFEQCRLALDALDAAADAVGDANLAPRGVLKVSAPVWCATPRFAQVLADYKRACPAVTIDLHLENRHVDLASEGFDLALRATGEPSPALIARPLCDVSFRLVATPSFVEARRLAHADDDTPLPAILPNYIPAERADRMAQYLSRQTPAWRLQTALRSSDSTLTYHAVMAGMGAALLPSWLVDSDLEAGWLVRLELSDLLKVPLFAVYTSRKHMPPKLRSFIDFVVAALATPARGAVA